MRTSIKGKKALVTGASRGIGKAIVVDLLKNGAEVIGTAKSIQNLENLGNELVEHRSQFSTIAADLSVNEGVHQLCDTIKNRVGDIDIIVNNAAIFHFELLENITDELLENSFAVNALAPIKICRAFAPAMAEKQWGRIINVCSSSAYFGGGTEGHCVYSPTKHALLGFSRALDDELREKNVRVGTVSPAGVNTDMIADRKDLEPKSLMSADDVAEAATFLITSEGPGVVYEMRLWRMYR